MRVPKDQCLLVYRYMDGGVQLVHVATVRAAAKVTAEAIGVDRSKMTGAIHVVVSDDAGNAEYQMSYFTGARLKSPTTQPVQEPPRVNP